MCHGKSGMHKHKGHKHGKIGVGALLNGKAVKDPEFRPQLMSKTMFKIQKVK